MIALEPIFQEQKSVDTHNRYRDQMATLEYEISSYLKWQGFEVIGKYQKGSAIDQTLLNELKSKVVEFVTT